MLHERMYPIKEEIKSLCRHCDELFARGEDEAAVEVMEQLRLKQRSLPVEDVEFRVLSRKHWSRYDQRMTEMTEERRRPRVHLEGIYLSFMAANLVNQDDLSPTPYGDLNLQR